jgi:phosphopantetheinyl transferase (holo-ACP synthase)
MISAGNDIVSLTATNVTRTKSPEFYQKIISPAEKALFDTLNQAILPFDRFVWLLWSVKESAYKYLHRLNPGIVFTPVKFEVRSIVIPGGYAYPSVDGDEITGQGFSDIKTFKVTVNFTGKTLYARVIMNNEFVLSTVNHSNDFNDIYWGIKRVEDSSYKYQSAEVRTFLLDKLRVLTGLNEPSIVKNEDEVPVLFNNNQQLNIPLSLSHHGPWVAFSFHYAVAALV